MTREEAIEILERRTTIPGDGYSYEQINEAIDTAIFALRRVSREQVEKVWRGEWIEDKYSFSHCSLCGYEQEEPELITPFCANCGAPMTDEAVQMMMERLEAMWDEKD